MKLAVQQGQKDSAQLREAIRNELIHRELLSQAAMKEGFDKSINLADRLMQLKQSLLVQAYIDHYLKLNPITEAQLQKEYKKQKKS